MINMVNTGDPFAKPIGADKHNKFEIKLRQEAPLTPIDILQQKFFLKKGYLKLILNQKEQAKQSFI